MAIQIDEFGQSILDRYIDTVNAYNSQVTKAKKVPTRDEFTETFIENEPRFNDINKQIASLIEQVVTLEEQRMQNAAPLIDEAYAAELAASGIDPEALKEMRTKVNAAAKYLTSMYGDEVLADTPKVEGLRAASSGNTGTTGVRRIRGFDIYINDVLSFIVNQKGEKKSTFTSAAKDLEVEVVDLQRAFFDAAGSEDVKAPGFPASVEFKFNDGDGNPHAIRVAKVGDSSDEE